MSTEVEVPELPSCDFCEDSARYDAKTKLGPWAYLCPIDWKEHTDQQLGTGHGQRLVTSDEVEEREKGHDED